MTVYSLLLASGSAIGPVAAAYTSANKNDWRWFFYVCIIITSINIMTLLLFLPETTYPRSSKQAGVVLEGSENTMGEIETQHDTISTSNRPRSVWNDIFFVHHPYVGSQRHGNIWTVFLRPFYFLISIPVLFACIEYGISLGW